MALPPLGWGSTEKLCPPYVKCPHQQPWLADPSWVWEGQGGRGPVRDTAACHLGSTHCSGHAAGWAPRRLGHVLCIN